MRELIVFECEGEQLAGSLDRASGTTGVLMVTGGSQTRIGSHRMYEHLANELSEHDYPCFRFDRRGVGDSSGTDPGYRGSGPDLAAALKVFSEACPHLQTIIGFGLCDGGTALALFGSPRLDGLVLANPWMVEVDDDVPAPAAIRAHYRQRLKSVEGWKRLLTGALSFRKLLNGLARLARTPAVNTLAADMAAALRTSRMPVTVLLAERDNTAVAAEAELDGPLFRGVPIMRQHLPTDSHTFARPGDLEALQHAVLAALQDHRTRLSGLPPASSLR